jgi:type I restriction-modification system DNA methylase subunit
MQLFQSSIFKSISYDEALIATRWAEYQKYLAKVEYIEDVKEEKYQEGFLHDIFELCLGYTLDSTNPKAYNLEREKRNETDGKKADGVIIIDGRVVAVIELKAQNTKDLNRVEDQAFGYLVSHSYARFVIISNFDELRFYIDKKTAYEKFSLFSLDYKAFKKLHTILSFESIKADIPLTLKEKSANFEKEISKKLYSDYSTFRTSIFENLIVKNPEQDKSQLLRLTQKLCDRVIFILFAEDRGLLTPNTINEIRTRHQNDGFGDRSMYDYYKLYFDAINAGNERLDIPKYNGGLFAKDELLDSLILDDTILDLQAQKLSDYDFASDIGVNILGHIFEQSLTDLEELNASINDTNFDTKKSKRKKDGVFYTPEYITRYIVENTLGKLCKDKRQELKIERDKLSSPKNPKKPTKTEKTTKTNLETYKEWLFDLKILDPACGSGAFLNQALEFLIIEHKNLQDDLAKMGDLFASYAVEESVLENNLYGVDINEDAVEIARLSLWIRTAVKGRELTRLADKIKCGNSLIDDKSVVDNAFVWEEEFPEVFERGGFDVVIGNPPYGAKLEKEKKFYKIQTNESAILFMQKSYTLLRDKGKHGFIIPKPFIYASNWSKIRDVFLNELYLLVDCGKVWDNVKLEQIIYLLDKNVTTTIYHNLLLVNDDFNSISNISKTSYQEYEFLLNQVTTLEQDIAKKIKYNRYNLLEISMISNRGGMFQKFVSQIGNKIVLAGASIQRFEIKKVKGYLEKIDILTENSFLRENSVLFQEIIAHIMNPSGHIKLTGTLINHNLNNYIILDTIQQITLNSNFSNKFILALLNSKLLNWYIYRFIFAKAIRTMHFSNQVIKRIPIPKITIKEQEPFITLVDIILISKENIQKYNKYIDSLNVIEKIEIKSEIENLEITIKKSLDEIDKMVYELYGLTEDEVAIVEGKV